MKDTEPRLQTSTDHCDPPWGWWEGEAVTTFEDASQAGWAVPVEGRLEPQAPWRDGCGQN